MKILKDFLENFRSFAGSSIFLFIGFLMSFGFFSFFSSGHAPGDATGFVVGLIGVLIIIIALLKILIGAIKNKKMIYFAQLLAFFVLYIIGVTVFINISSSFKSSPVEKKDEKPVYTYDSPITIYRRTCKDYHLYGLTEAQRDNYIAKYNGKYIKNWTLLVTNVSTNNGVSGHFTNKFGVTFSDYQIKSRGRLPADMLKIRPGSRYKIKSAKLKIDKMEVLSEMWADYAIENIEFY